MGVNGSELVWMGVGGSAWKWVGARFSMTHFIIVCQIHMYKESTSCDCLTVKVLLVQNRHNIRSLTDFSGNRTNNHLHRKQTLNHLAKLGERSFPVVAGSNPFTVIYFMTLLK